MKKWFCLACFLLLVFFPLASEGAEEKPDEYTIKGKTAFLFSFYGLNISPYEGGIGIKKGISKSTALIVSLQFNYDREEQEVTNESSGLDYKDTRIGILFGFENHLGQIKSISPYWGLSLLVGHSKYYYKFTQPLDWGDDFYSSEEKLLFITPSLFLGFEIKIIDNVFLAGQYALGYEYGFGTAEFKDPTSTEKQNLRVTDAGVNTSSIILTIYF
jgi:hypothetical protein